MKKILLLCSLIIAVSSIPAFGLTIDDTVSPDDMAQALVGSGVTISNVTYTGAAVASGSFSGGVAAGIGIESGIVLTSGFASHLTNTTNTSTGITGDNQLSGDSDLDSLGVGTTYDATVLEFDFTSNSNAAYFQYVFGSDEYTEYVNDGVSDVFGFFSVNGNAALVPTTTTPVAIDTVNHLVNPGYYNGNEAGQYPFEYDGFTDVFTAEILGLTIGQTYHIKLAIADVGDYILDSGVFLKAGSFSDNDDFGPVPEPTTMLLFGLGILGIAGVSRKKTA